MRYTICAVVGILSIIASLVFSVWGAIVSQIAFWGGLLDVGTGWGIVLGIITSEVSWIFALFVGFYNGDWQGALLFMWAIIALFVGFTSIAVAKD